MSLSNENVSNQTENYVNQIEKKTPLLVREIKEYDDGVKVCLEYKNNVKVREQWLVTVTDTDTDQIKSYMDEYLYKYLDFDDFGRNDELPDYVEYYDNGNKKLEQWHNASRDERQYEDLPILIEYFENGNKKAEEWSDNNIEDELCVNDNPTRIEYFENGNKKLEQWSIECDKHRIDGPALIEYYENGCVMREEWYVRGECHRKGRLPARIEYNQNGVVKRKEWFKKIN